LTSQAVDSVDSHKKRACPHYPQPYDDGDDAPLLWVGALGTLPEENHNKHSLKWYSFLGELPTHHVGHLKAGLGKGWPLRIVNRWPGLSLSSTRGWPLRIVNR